MTFRDKAWSPYAAGVLIGLLQIPAFLLIDTALGTSSSYVTIAAHIAAFADASVNKMDYLAKHMYGAKNLWQVAMVVGIAIGAFSACPAASRSPLFGKRPLVSTVCRAAHRWPSPAVSSWSSALASPTAARLATAYPAWRSLRSAPPLPWLPCLPVRLLPRF